MNSILTDSEVTALESCVPDDVKDRLLALAIERHGRDITPVSGETELSGCYRIFGKHYTLWYNDIKGSSHVEKELIENKQIN